MLQFTENRPGGYFFRLRSDPGFPDGQGIRKGLQLQLEGVSGTVSGGIGIVPRSKRYPGDNQRRLCLAGFVLFADKFGKVFKRQCRVVGDRAEGVAFGAFFQQLPGFPDFILRAFEYNEHFPERRQLPRAGIGLDLYAGSEAKQDKGRQGAKHGYGVWTTQTKVSGEILLTGTGIFKDILIAASQTGQKILPGIPGYFPREFFEKPAAGSRVGYASEVAFFPQQI